MKKKKRILISLAMGMVLGVFCILGLAGRIPAGGALPNNRIYLAGGWFNRVVMGFAIGLAGDITLVREKDDTLNICIRGALIGGFISVGFAFFQQFIDVPFFLSGFGFGLINDLVSSKIS